MPKRRPQVTQADIARAIRAMQAAGYDVEVVLTRDGAVVRPVRIEKDGDERSPITDSEDDYLVI